MQLTQLFADEDAVSPVIGVILMVAITVILAAVIGTFVLGLGDNVQDEAPNANFQFSYSGDFSADTGEMEITHNGGQNVDTSNIQVQVGSVLAFDAGAEANSWTNDAGWDDGSGAGITISTGDSVTFTEPSGTDETGEDVRVIWNSPSGGTSNTIGSSTVP